MVMVIACSLRQLSEVVTIKSLIIPCLIGELTELREADDQYNYE